MKGVEEAESDVLEAINDKQEVTYNELKDFAASLEISAETLSKALSELEKASVIASRNSGGVLTYYMLQEKPLIKRIFIVEDEKNISKLMSIAVGKGYDITQIYDGNEALKKIKYEKPDLVILDLMLPGMDGLEICQSIKKDPQLAETTVIIVSAMDPTSGRFKGIKYGADYYIKKPFDPDELRSLVTIFLKKKGKRFDPLIDLPNEDRISESVERALSASESGYRIGRLRVEGLAGFAEKFGTESGVTILRLVSQLLQDKVKEMGGSVFVGFLNGDDFVIGGSGNGVDRIVEGVTAEFNAVQPFIYQSGGYKPIELGIENLYGVQPAALSLSYTDIKREGIIERRTEVLRHKRSDDIGSYTYDELRHILGSDSLDITITRDSNGVKLSIGKRGDEEK